MQQALLDMYKSGQDKNKYSKALDKATGAQRPFEGRHRERHLKMMAETWPVAQIDPNSYLGVALQNAGRLTDGPPSSPSSSLSEESSEQSSDSDGDSERPRKKSRACQ